MTSIDQRTETPNLVFKNFDDIIVSTKTFIIKTNLILDLKKLFETLPISDYIVIPKRRGRKKHKIVETNPNKDVINGSIVTMKYENRMRGVDLKQRKSHAKKKKSKWFRNSFTIVIILDGKPVNFKICHNGILQVTGCKIDSQADDCLKFIWSFIKDKTPDIYTLSSGDNLECIIIPAMRNIDFSLGFNVDREKLAKYMSTQTEFHSLLETSFGYTGVNIKIPITHDITKLMLKALSFKDEIIESEISYGDYLKLLPEKEQHKKINKERYNTFLCFHSGKIIQSGLTAEFMRDAYNYFLRIIKTCYGQIVEKLDV